MATVIVDHTPPRSCQNRDHLETVILKRNISALGGSFPLGCWNSLYEQLLKGRDGAAFAGCGCGPF